MPVSGISVELFLGAGAFGLYHVNARKDGWFPHTDLISPRGTG